MTDTNCSSQTDSSIRSKQGFFHPALAIEFELAAALGRCVDAVSATMIVFRPI